MMKYISQKEPLLHDVFTVREVAEYLKTSRTQVRHMIASRELDAVKVGREYRVPQESLRKFAAVGQ